MQETILVVDDDPGHLITLKTLITSWGYRVETVDDGTAAVDRIQEGPVDLILMDVRMAVMGGIEALQRIKAYNPAIPIIIMTAYSSVASAVEALKAGAYDYLIKPLDFDALKLSIQRAREHAGLKVENRELKARLGAGFHAQQIIGKSQAIKALMDMLAMIAPSEATVLITGESGTGKELIARSIHFNSPRKDNPLVVVNCAAIAETLLESELFGHEKGPSPERTARARGVFSKPMGAACFWMKSPKPRRPCRPSCCAQSRNARFSGWAARTPCMWMFALSPPPTATWPRKSSRAGSAKTCTIGSMWSCWRCRRCVGAWMTFPFWRTILWNFSPPGTASASKAFHRRPWTCWSSMVGRAMCVSLKTRSNARLF
jgi:CheY-like chemotaxis protein